MIMGALGGALVMRYLSPTVPAIVMILAVVLISMLFGVIYSALLAVACINFKADQTIVGTALNMLGLAASTSSSRRSISPPTPMTSPRSSSTARRRSSSS